MTIKPPYDDYISVGKKALPKPVFSENSHSPKKIDQQTMIASLRSPPKAKSPYLRKPLAEATRQYVDVEECVQEVAQVMPRAGYLDPSSPPHSPVKGGGISGTQQNVEIDRTKQIGKGSFARIWSGTIKKLDQNKPVAVKEFKDAYEERELFVVEQLMQEKPKGLLRIYGKLLQGSGRAHVVMKLCNQGSAVQFFNENISDKPACHQKLLSMLKVLQEFHKSGFCHRDIHEENFLSHQPKKGAIQEYLVDFGHAGSLTQGKQLPLKGRPLFLVNSPRVFSRLYHEAKAAYIQAKDASEEAKASEAFQDYDQFADRYGRELDLFQMGMLCFRVCAEESGPIKMGSENHSQVALVKKLTELELELRHETDEVRKEAFLEQMSYFFNNRFPSIPPALAYVITSLMNFPDPMPLDEAIARWAEAIL